MDRWTVIIGHQALAILLLAGCTRPGDNSGEVVEPPSPPTGATIEASGFVTIERAPPEPFAEEPPPPQPEQPTEKLARESGISVAEAEGRMNPDEATMRAANALSAKLRSGARGNFVGARIIRDPNPRYVFHFRRDGAATLARFTTERRFEAVDGGVPFEELDPILHEWMARFARHRLASSAATNPFEGTVEIDIGVSKQEYDAIAAREGWQVPPNVKLEFAPEIDPATVVAADLAPFIRLFPRADRAPGAVLSVAKGGRIVLRDGCFRLDAPEGEDPLVLFGRNSQLLRDSEGFMIVRSRANPDIRARIGEHMTWGGYPPADEGEADVKALRNACGGGPIESVGEPTSTRLFRIRPGAIDAYAQAKRISRRQVWKEITACWQEQEAAADDGRPQSAQRECDWPFPPK